MYKILKKISGFIMTLLMVISTVFTSSTYAADQPPNPLTKEGYTLDFSDEFNGPELDKTKWTDYYLPHWTKNPENAKAQYKFEDGSLIEYITEDQKPWSPEHDGTVRSSAIMSFDKNWIHNFSGTTDNQDREPWVGYATTYGYFEIRAKFADCSGGGHQAWWMVGMQNDTDDWFNSMETGEIDIIESFFSKPDTWRIAAYGWNDPNFQTSWMISEEPVPSGDPTSEYHIYGLDWSPGSLKFYYDNELYKEINQAPDYPMGTILNIYTDAGSGEHNNVWPKQWAIDYFRVWKKDGGYEIPSYHIKNRETGKYLYIEENNDKVSYGDLNEFDTNGVWKKEQAGDYIRLKNEKTEDYLHVESQSGFLEHGKVPKTYYSAQWKSENEGNYLRFNNRWKNNSYIHIEDQMGVVQYGNVSKEYWSSQWELIPVDLEVK